MPACEHIAQRGPGGAGADDAGPIPGFRHVAKIPGDSQYCDKQDRQNGGAVEQIEANDAGCEIAARGASVPAVSIVSQYSTFVVGTIGRRPPAKEGMSGWAVRSASAKTVSSSVRPGSITA